MADVTEELMFAFHLVLASAASVADAAVVRAIVVSAIPSPVIDSGKRDPCPGACTALLQP